MAESCYVILQIGVGPGRVAPSDALIVQKNGERFELRDDIWIERLDEEFSKNIQKACEPPHFNIDVEPSDRHLDAFVRRVPKTETRTHEGLAELVATIALSRLINPTSAGERHSCKAFQFGSTKSAIQAIQFSGISPDVILGPNSRDWLSRDDGQELLNLMPWVSDKQMLPRVHRAYWYHEHAMRSYYLDVRWPAIVAALEAMVNTDENDCAWQFRDRVRQLAVDFKVALDDAELQRVWQLRSKLVHAEGFLYNLNVVLPSSPDSALYMKVEGLLRSVVRRCLLDDNFGRFFRDSISVEKQFPLSPKPQQKRALRARGKISP